MYCFMYFLLKLSKPLKYGVRSHPPLIGEKGGKGDIENLRIIYKISKG